MEREDVVFELLLSFMKNQFTDSWLLNKFMELINLYAIYPSHVTSYYVKFIRKSVWFVI